MDWCTASLRRTPTAHGALVAESPISRVLLSLIIVAAHSIYQMHETYSMS